MTSYTVGILIIGSLFWDTREHRESWRRARLEIGHEIPVRVPIRYGRRSDKSRGKTYTMVFSNELSTERYGWALVVPCRNPVMSADELVIEGKALWAAEQKTLSKPGPLSASWGEVGLLTNPCRPKLNAIKEGWKQYIAQNERDNYCSNASKQARVNPDGLLTIPWPLTESDDRVDMDFLLATATVPTLQDGKYATPETIAEAWENALKYQRYFDENRRAGITTADDYAIIKHLCES